MFGIGWTEFIFIGLILLVFVGPKHLPGMLRKFGQIVGELRSASRELRDQIEVEIKDIESPSNIARKVAQDLIEDLPSPYDDVIETKEDIERELKESAQTALKNESAEKEPDEKPSQTKSGRDPS
ncbi:MAG: twin-arginine translocase TatA/TatE family subunit [Proteobacteria bacterium]|nr:twin-arginine translocase TatA/TatE family subunit [Pseudomonadota bacterium]